MFTMDKNSASLVEAINNLDYNSINKLLDKGWSGDDQMKVLEVTLDSFIDVDVFKRILDSVGDVKIPLWFLFKRYSFEQMNSAYKTTDFIHKFNAIIVRKFSVNVPDNTYLTGNIGVYTLLETLQGQILNMNMIQSVYNILKKNGTVFNRQSILTTLLKTIDEGKLDCYDFIVENEVDIEYHSYTAYGYYGGGCTYAHCSVCEREGNEITPGRINGIPPPLFSKEEIRLIKNRDYNFVKNLAGFGLYLGYSLINSEGEYMHTRSADYDIEKDVGGGSWYISIDCYKILYKDIFLKAKISPYHDPFKFRIDIKGRLMEFSKYNVKNCDTGWMINYNGVREKGDIDPFLKLEAVNYRSSVYIYDIADILR